MEGLVWITYGFFQRFHLLMFEVLKSRMKFQYLMNILEYFLTKSLHPKMKIKFKPCSSYFGDGAAQSQADTSTITSDYSPSPHQTTPTPQSDMRECSYTSVQLSHPPTVTTLNFCAYLVGKPMGCHTYLLPQLPSSHFTDPSDCIVLCSSILGPTLFTNEDQAIDGIDVAQPTCTIIHEEYDWASKHEPMLKDDLLLSLPPPLFPDISNHFVISDFPCVNPSTNASMPGHSYNTPDVSPWFQAKRTNISLRIHLTFHLPFPEMQRVKILSSHIPLYMIHQIMRMPTNILNFFIMVFVIFVLLHLIMILIHLLLIFLSCWSLMIYLFMKWKPHRLSRHFSLRWWLCQARTVLRSVPLLIENFWNTHGSSSPICMHWGSIQHIDFASSTGVTWSHHSCTRGIIHNKHTCKA